MPSKSLVTLLLVVIVCPIILSGQARPSAADLRKARALVSKLKALEQQGRQMESLRHTNDLRKIRQCGDRMRVLKAKVNAIRDEADALPPSLRIHLGTAAIGLSNCVVCSDNALSYCDMVRSDIQAGEKKLR